MKAKKRGCTEVVFVMGEEGFVAVATEALDNFLTTAYVTNNTDGSLRHHHVYVTGPPNVRLKGPSPENDVDVNASFTPVED